jgi:hypothetical protein
MRLYEPAKGFFSFPIKKFNELTQKKNTQTIEPAGPPAKQHRKPPRKRKPVYILRGKPERNKIYCPRKKKKT